MIRKRIVSAPFIVIVMLLQVQAFVAADEASTVKRFEHAKVSEPQLIAFVKNMPKGADLHSHVSGAVYAETYLDAAIKSNLFFDPNTSLFSDKETPGSVPAERLKSDSALASKFLDAASMRGYNPAIQSGHDHFFNTFSYFDLPASKVGTNAMLAEAILRAKAQNVQYLEIMAGVAPGDALRKARGNPPAIDDMEKALAEMRNRFPALITEAKVYLDNTDSEIAKAVGVKAPVTGVGGPINIRYVYSVNRTAPNRDFFANMACGMALVKADKRVVGVNILAPEDDVSARQNFDTQMKIIDFLWRRMGQPNLTLHAGELTLAISPVEVMRSRIRKTIEVGHAKRIGHGVSIAWEDDLPGLLQEMKAKHVAVEINLTSNDGILGVSGDRHPFNLYRDAGIPFNLNTDDEGVNRSNLTMEYVRAIRTYKLSYPEVKKLARNSIEYSFLPGSSLYVNGDYTNLRPELKGVRSPNWIPDQHTLKLISTSDKLAEEVRLERAFVEFENRN